MPDSRQRNSKKSASCRSNRKSQTVAEVTRKSRTPKQLVKVGYATSPLKRIAKTLQYKNQKYTENLDNENDEHVIL